MFGLGGCPDTSPGLSKATREGFGVAPPLPVPHVSLVSSPCFSLTLQINKARNKQPRAAFGTKWVLRPRKQQWGQNPLVCKRGPGPVWEAVERSRMRPSGLMMRCMGREGSPGDPQTRSLVHGRDHDCAPAPAPVVLLGTETPEEIH